MPQPDFRDRALHAILEGGLRVIPFQKTLINTLAGSVNCLFQCAGMPAAGAYPGNALEANVINPGLVANILGTSDRIISSGNRQLLMKAEAYNNIASFSGVLMIADLLATYRGLPANTAVAQDLSTVGSAAGRSVLPRYTDGRGVRIFGDVTTALGATPVSLQLSYTNELGTSGKVSTSTTVASAPQTRSINVPSRDPFFGLPLASGDKGVRSIQTAQLSGTTGAAGVYSLILYRPLMTLQVQQFGTANTANYGQNVSLGEVFTPEILPGAVLVFFWLPLTAVNDTLSGTLTTLKVGKGR